MHNLIYSYIFWFVDIEEGGKKVLLKSFWENDFIKYSYHIGFRKTVQTDDSYLKHHYFPNALLLSIYQIIVYLSDYCLFIRLLSIYQIIVYLSDYCLFIR